MVNNTKNIELTVKSERGTTTDNNVLFYTEKYALYARYDYIVANQEYSATVFVTYLFEYKRNSETGELTIIETKDIDTVTEADIDAVISADYELKARIINGNNLVKSKLNKIYHCDTTGYNFDSTREPTYEIVTNSDSGSGDDPSGYVDFYVKA